MIKRTIKPAAGNSSITPEAARAAARFVYRDRSTGKYVILKHDESGRVVEKRVVSAKSGNGKQKAARTSSNAARETTASKKR